MTLVPPQTEQALQKAMRGSAHAILLAGPAGAGKGYLARTFASQKLGLNLPELANYPYFKSIQQADGVLGIDQVRELHKFLHLKTIGTGTIRRIALLEDAHLMTQEAQNALLKSLEEPPADTVMILTSPATMQLRDTIYSRVQKISVQPVSKTLAIEYFGSSFPTEAIQKAHAISGGYAGLLYALLHDKEHALAAQIQAAKTLLASDNFTRLTRIDELSKQKDSLPLFLQACKLIAATALHQAAAKGNSRTTARWLRTLRLIHDAQASLPHNPNTKLLLTHVFLGI